jgi:hypothetical protein
MLGVIPMELWVLILTCYILWDFGLRDSFNQLLDILVKISIPNMIVDCSPQESQSLEKRFLSLLFW